MAQRAPKQWTLSKRETITSYECWRQNLQYTLSLDANFAPFLVDQATWGKKTNASPLRERRAKSRLAMQFRIAHNLVDIPAADHLQTYTSRKGNAAKFRVPYARTVARVHRHISDPGEGVKGRKHGTTLNRLRTGVGRYKASTKKWGLADSAACECGEPEQTAYHIINSCPLHRPPSEAGIFEVGPLTRAWLQQTELTI